MKWGRRRLGKASDKIDEWIAEQVEVEHGPQFREKKEEYEAVQGRLEEKPVEQSEERNDESHDGDDMRDEEEGCEADGDGVQNEELEDAVIKPSEESRCTKGVPI